MKSNGLRLGTADLLDFGAIMATDAGKRKELIAQCRLCERGLAIRRKDFLHLHHPRRCRCAAAENYKLAVESIRAIAQACASVGASLAIEGWPGGAPQLANLCCTPETTRTFIKDVGAGSGLNYDPSHLIRLGVDHLRFLKEFLPQVKHVHAKDTALMPDALYDFGTQAATFAKPHGFGEWTWHYTIPGQGVAKWGEIFSMLSGAGYKGIVSVELEDEKFNGSEQGEKNGFMNSLRFLESTDFPNAVTVDQM